MNMNEIVTVIQGVGFPIVAAGAMFWSNYKTNQTINGFLDRQLQLMESIIRGSSEDEENGVD